MTASALPNQSVDGPSGSSRASMGRAGPAPAPRVSARFGDRSERERVFAWLESGLRPGRPGRLAQEYPLLFAAESAAIPITVWQGARPASFCLLWPVTFALARGRLRTALISLVYTDPRDRGQGLARAALARALAEARARELGLCLLWSELADFYAAQGFSRAGRETLLVIDDEVLARAGSNLAPHDREALRIGRARLEDWEAIEAIRARRSCHAPLPPDASALASIPDLDVRVARGPEGVVAFAMCGRGDDFKGVVHEWGGETVGVLRCCEALLGDAAGPGAGLLLLSPEERSEVPFRLRSAGARLLRNALGFFAIASLPALAEDLADLAPDVASALRLAPVAPRPPGAVEHVASEGSPCDDDAPLAASELLALLFSDATDPVGATARARLGSRLPATVLAQLPLPFFVWGLESI